MFTHMTLDDLEMTFQIVGVGLASTIDPTHQVSSPNTNVYPCDLG